MSVRRNHCTAQGINIVGSVYIAREFCLNARAWNIPTFSKLLDPKQNAFTTRFGSVICINASKISQRWSF